MRSVQAPKSTKARMHQTTVRFGNDLWDDLEQESARLGVSVAQYVREAALARLAYQAGQRGNSVYSEALGEAAVSPLGAVPPLEPALAAREAAMENLEGSAALWNQGRLARARARELAERASRLEGGSQLRARARARAPTPGLRLGLGLGGRWSSGTVGVVCCCGAGVVVVSWGAVSCGVVSSSGTVSWGVVSSGTVSAGSSSAGLSLPRSRPPKRVVLRLPSPSDCPAISSGSVRMAAAMTNASRVVSNTILGWMRPQRARLCPVDADLVGSPSRSRATRAGSSCWPWAGPPRGLAGSPGGRWSRAARSPSWAGAASRSRSRRSRA